MIVISYYNCEFPGSIIGSTSGSGPESRGSNPRWEAMFPNKLFNKIVGVLFILLSLVVFILGARYHSDGTTFVLTAFFVGSLALAFGAACLLVEPL